MKKENVEYFQDYEVLDCFIDFIIENLYNSLQSEFEKNKVDTISTFYDKYESVFFGVQLEDKNGKRTDILDENFTSDNLLEEIIGKKVKAIFKHYANDTEKLPILTRILNVKYIDYLISKFGKKVKKEVA